MVTGHVKPVVHDLGVVQTSVIEDVDRRLSTFQIGHTVSSICYMSFLAIYWGDFNQFS